MRKKWWGTLLTILLCSMMLIGCSQTTNPDIAANQDATEEKKIDTTTMEKERKKYLEQQLMPPQFGGIVHCAAEQVEEKWEGNHGKWYGWVFCLELQEDGSEGAGVSLPVVLELKKIDGNVTITGHATPEDGSEYEQSFRRLFPESVREDLSQEKIDLDALEQEVKQQGATAP
ncbi:hypothetical protein [Desmospora activa]|uniref:Lipoprotein n=1 Tax=Desmospora activa DSM 45169 TaxID=1121389 RepID=A0A2T4YXS6_9BACL|nr:hypothetical protein [Desmospora activa]PTM51335.1 hypothetical protein C8J48_3779 [Desmospora activa DSM 45169]